LGDIGVVQMERFFFNWDVEKEVVKWTGLKCFVMKEMNVQLP
jgi:hypothetical protein